MICEVSERFRNLLVTVLTDWSLSYPYQLEICLDWVCSCHAFEPYSIFCLSATPNNSGDNSSTTASSRLRLGALSLGRGLENFSAHSRTIGRIRSQKGPYFGGPGQISGFSACHGLPSSASSSARSFRRYPVWLFTLTSVTLPSH